MSFRLTEEVLASSGSDEGFATAASDFLFVIDCTQTMQWVLDSICKYLMDVVKIFEDGKLRMRYGVLEFRDRKYDQTNSLIFHKFNTSYFTEDVGNIKKTLESLKAKMGGPPKESVFDALKHAVEDPDWRDDATRIVVLFTDAEPHSPDLEVKSWDECIDIIEESKIDMLHLVVAEEHAEQYRKLRLIQGPDGEDLPGDLVILGDSEQSGDKLRQILEGIGYSSQRKAAMDNAKRGFRGT